MLPFNFPESIEVCREMLPFNCPESIEVCKERRCCHLTLLRVYKCVKRDVAI